MEIRELSAAILASRAETSNERATVVGISGIDASGKGYISAKLADSLDDLNVAIVNVDGWLNLPHIRFDPARPAENFYQNALRLDEMFARLVLPLKEARRVDITADYTEETAADFRPHGYIFEDTDIILVEGIFIFKSRFVEHFDLKIWVDCSFETALFRAINRAQEGLPSEETIHAYNTIYFPAQRLHFAADRPREVADLIFDNS